MGPARGALRYLGVHSPRGTTLRNVEPSSEFKKPSKVRTEDTTHPTTTNHHPHTQPHTSTVNIYHSRKVFKKWNEMNVKDGRFAMVPNIDYGIVKSTNKQKIGKYKLQEIEKRKELGKNKKLDQRQFLLNNTRDRSERFFGSLNENVRKRVER